MADESTLFRILFAVVLFVSMAIVITYRRRAEVAGGKVERATAMKEEGGLIWLPLRLLGVGLWLGAPLYVIAPGLFRWAALDLPVWARWIGVGMGLVFPFVVTWTQRSLGNNVTKTVVTKQEHTLVTSGPYRWVRHPLYTLGFLFFVALSLIGATWYFAVLMALGFIPLFVRTRKEEAMLEARFGDAYREYRQRTGRFFPRLVG
jgi:protein-S-isoprenylcysteine O-methyltransferase Ste14